MPVDITKDFFRIRQKNPKLFMQFRNITLSSPKGISAIYGKLRATKKWVIQSLLFSRKKWDMTRVRAWIKSHNYVFPAKASVRPGKLTSPFVIDTVVENHDVEYNVIDVVVIRDGPGKNQIYLEADGQVYIENFTAEAVHALAETLEGVGLEVYVVEGQEGGKQYVHPSAEINRQTPVGLVPHQVGFLKDLWVDTTSEAGKLLLRAKAYLNQSQFAKDLRAVIRAAFEQGARYIPAPSINGMMLWSPQRRNDRNFFDALKVLSMRSVEFVSRPAAGGAIYAVIEGERMNFLELLKQYCKQFAITGNFDADTPASFLESVKQPDETVNKISAVFGADQDEATAMAILAEAALSAGLDTGEGEGTQEPGAAASPSEPPEGSSIGQEPPAAGIPQSPPAPQEPSGTPDGVVTTPQPQTPPPQPMAGTGQAPASPVQTPPPSSPSPPPQPMGTEGQNPSGGEGAINAQVVQQLGTLTRLAQQNAGFIAQQTNVNKMLLDYVANDQHTRRKDAMVAMVNEAVSQGLPEHRKAYWMKMVETGQIAEANSLKVFLDADKETESTHELQVLENFKDLPVSTRHLAGITIGASERDIPFVRTKMLFQLPCTEAEQTLVTQRGVRPYMSLDDMYKDLVPGDSEYTGVPYGGQGPQYQRWYQRFVTEGVAAGDEVVKSTDFANILLQVVGELGLSRWEMLDKSFLDLCETGPNFANYIDSNVVVYGSAPDMKEWTEDGGYEDLEAGARKPVTTQVKDWGGIMRWSKRVVIDNRLDMITEDVNAQIDATWRTVGRAVFDKILGWGIPVGSSDPIINGLKMQDGNGVLYQAGGIRRNYVDGDGRMYGNLVKLLNLMMEQEDIAKPTQDPQMLVLVPGMVVCVNTAWAVINGYWNAQYKPGTENEPNELGLPNNQKPTVVGVHQGFLRDRKDFVAMLPVPALKGVLRVQYFNGQTQPKITWQNQPPMGRVFENGEIAAQFDFPLRITLIREKGAYSSHNSQQP